ncbi:unnamed protein product [Phaedon cochleariae]|uniref:Protein I'm not dead yet n=1 Tax=Phaedon cochleariae TaxID=80249 RepID=A0A9P0DYI8_PHACE|nr:unnamed protein product [Phaedon cochleariae]
MASLILQALKLYWRTLFLLIYPLVLLPVFLAENTPAFRCLYVVLLMAGYWVLEVLPLAVTALIPMVLFPLMGILSTKKTSLAYMKETNMMSIGGLIIAIAVEQCNLHKRVALHVMKIVGCSPRRLNVGLCCVTMFVSMWISNTAAAAMMIPIMQATLTSLEEQGIIAVYGTNADRDQLSYPTEANAEENANRKPTKITMCYFISTAYAATIGGSGCIIGSGMNLAFKGLYETRFPDSPGVEFSSWMLLNLPIMLVTMFFVIIWMQFHFLGLFRPNSDDAKKIKIGPEGRFIAKSIMDQQLHELGRMSFHEICVGICFVLVVLLWFFKRPGFMKGWTEYITDTNTGDATIAILVVLILFLCPSKSEFIYSLSKDESKRPKSSSPSLITWKTVNQKMPWSLLFLLGGGFAMADGSQESGMSKMIAEYLRNFGTLDKHYVMLVSCATIGLLTQVFSSNIACATLVIPVMADLSVISKIHPMFLMMSSALCCGYAYCLPVSTPPNAIAVAACNMPTWNVIKVGSGILVINLVVLFSIYPFYGNIIWDFDTYPEWAV